MVFDVCTAHPSIAIFSVAQVAWVSCDVSAASYKKYVVQHRAVDLLLVPWGTEEPLEFFGVRGVPAVRPRAGPPREAGR